MRLTEQTYGAGIVQPAHAHGTTSCSVVLAGTLWERVGAREELARPFSVVLKPRDTVHADRYGPSGACIARITLDEESSGAAQAWLPRLGAWRWVHCGPAARRFMALLQAIRPGVGADSSSALIEALVWEVMAAVDAEAAMPSGEPPAWLARVREAADDAAGGARLTDLAALAGVHPVYLARQFRRFHGCSISTYVHRLRVRHAAEMIGTSSLPLSQVASFVGFSDHPHMCRIFRRETGLTPTAYQQIRTEVRLVQDTPGRAA